MSSDNPDRPDATGRVPLVLLPGSLCDESMWRDQAAALSDIAVPHIVPLNGFDTIADMAAHVLEEAPAGPFALAGFSLGGFVAFEIVRQAASRVSRLALLSTSARGDSPEVIARRSANIAAFALDPEPVLDGFVAMVQVPGTDPGIGEVIRSTMHRFGPRDYIAQQKAMMARTDMRPLLGDIRCPTLVLCGEYDRATPPELSWEIAAGIPDAEYEELANVAHMTTLEAPDRVSRALRRWLGQAPVG